MKVRLRSGHFERWLVLWRATVDELFEGDRAELAKAHALRVARAFHGRLEAMTAAPVSGRAHRDPARAGSRLSRLRRARHEPRGEQREHARHARERERGGVGALGRQRQLLEL